MDENFMWEYHNDMSHCGTDNCNNNNGYYYNYNNPPVMTTPDYGHCNNNNNVQHCQKRLNSGCEVNSEKNDYCAMSYSVPNVVPHVVASSGVVSSSKKE